MRTMTVGKVWLVGAGPGDPGLITVRGLDVLREAEVVLFDPQSHPSLLELCPRAEKHEVGKRDDLQGPLQSDATKQMIAFARAGKKVVRLEVGDPFLFARGSEEAMALAEAGIPFEVVPGISSATGASAYAGVPLTHRDLSSSVTIISGSDEPGKEWSPAAWKKLATATDTLCVLMGMQRIEEIAAAIVEGGRPASTPAAAVQWGARPEQRVLTATLGDIAARVTAEGLTDPAVLFVGEVVALREKLRWFDKQALFGRRILVPRAPHQARATARAIRERAAEPVVFPVIEIDAPPDPERLARAARELGSYDWVVFTSANGVERLFGSLHDQGLDARAFGQAKIAVIGPKTGAALREQGLSADLVAEEFIGEGVAKAIVERGAPRRVLIPRALVAREQLPDMLRATGAHVDVVPAYETKPMSQERADLLRGLFEQRQVDVALFTSGSTVTSLCDALSDRAPELLGSVTVASIGPITTKALQERGIVPAVTAKVYTVAGLLDALEEHFGAS